VNRLEFGNGEASHHLIIDTATPGSAADAKLHEYAIGDQVECLSSQSVFGEGFEFTGGVQRPYGQVSFPEGVGRIYHGGQRIVFDFHYYNTGDAPVQARSAVNYHLTDEANVEHIAKVVGFSNFLIDTPPGESRSFVGECQYTQDVMVPSITRHTHRWGTDFTVWFSGGDKDGEHIWTSHDFQEDTLHEFEQPLLMKAGEGFRFECDYQNPEAAPLRFGPNATDEMCILFSLAWEAEGDTLSPQGCQIVQLGDDGIGRPLDPGSYPAPTAEQVQACRDGADLDPTCEECACNNCGAVIADCTADADCAPILECVQTTGCSGMACAGDCADAINQHSPGTGKLIQLGSCLGATCSTLCTF